MTITVADIKIMASARMVDATDGGGQMSATALQDGVENNVFPDISMLNRAQGALQLRKVFPAVLNAGTDTLLGTHVVLDDVPDDADVFGLILPSATGVVGVNPLTQTIADLAVQLNNSPEGYKYRGSVATTAVANAAASVLSVSGLRVPFIPKSTTAVAVSGPLFTPSTAPGSTVVGWEPTGQTIALTMTSGATSVIGAASTLGAGRLDMTTLAGSLTTAEGAGTVTVNLAAGTVTLTSAGGGFGTRVFTAAADGRSFTSVGTLTLTGFAVTAGVLVDVDLPRKSASATGSAAFDISLSTGVSLNSITFTAGGNEYRQLGSSEMFAPAPGSFQGALTSARINRATGVLSLVFSQTVGVQVYYADGGNTIALPSASLVSSGLIASGTASVTIDAGKVFGGASFSINGGGESGMYARGGNVYNSAGVLRGTVSPTGVLTLPGGNDGRSIVNWYACQRSASISVSNFTGTLDTNISPITVTGNTAAAAAFSATANSAGVFATSPVSGTYDKTTGALALTFSTPVKLEDLAYSGTRNNPAEATCDLWGINQALFANDGTVPILHLNDVVVLQNTVEIAAATYSNGNTVNCGRTDLSNVRIVGTNNAGILTGWSVDKVTGVVTITSIAGWAQPVRIRHSIEHVAVASQVTSSSVTLNRALTRQFASGSVLSSALVVGDMAARAGASFSQGTWTNVWSDTRIGDAITPQYQQISSPIVVSNLGSATERWAIIFTSASVFRLVGESLGQIATGDINSPFAPVNPATATPYFTIAATGWGSGWANGNVLRFNTSGGNAPVWMARVVRPSAPNSNADSLTIAVRGDIDA